MPEPQDPLKSVFKQAAAAGQAGARSVPVSVIAERGDRRRRRRLAAVAAVLCVAFAGTGAAVATLLPGGEGTTVPAGTPASSPDPARSTLPTGPLPSDTASSTMSDPPSSTPSTSVGGIPSDTPSDGATYPPSGTTTGIPSTSATPGQ